jgi:hypothetical protein
MPLDQSSSSSTWRPEFTEPKDTVWDLSRCPVGCEIHHKGWLKQVEPPPNNGINHLLIAARFRTHLTKTLLWYGFSPRTVDVVIWDIITWIIDQSLACQGQVQQFKNRKETDTSTMCSTGRVANLHRFKNPCGVKISHAQIDCSTSNQRLCLTSISQEIYGATCKF